MENKLVLAVLLIGIIAFAGCIESTTPPFEPEPIPSPQTQWLYYSPVQCGENPWEIWHNGLDRQYFQQPLEEDIVKEYYQTIHNVQILEFKALQLAPDTAVCLSCDCPRGDTLKILINKTDSEKMIELGWRTGPEKTGNVSFKTTKKSFAAGETIRFEFKNNTNYAVFFDGKATGPCLGAWLEIYKESNVSPDQQDWAGAPVPDLVSIINPSEDGWCIDTVGAQQKLLPGETATIEWPNPRIFDNDYNELEIAGTYYASIRYAQSAEGGLLREPFFTIKSNRFAISGENGSQCLPGPGCENRATRFCAKEGGNWDANNQSCLFEMVSCDGYDFLSGRSCQDQTSCKKAGYTIETRTTDNNNGNGQGTITLEGWCKVDANTECLLDEFTNESCP